MGQKYLRIMSSIVPMGVIGASLLLGSALPSVATERSLAHKALVSERLSAIREAVFAVVGTEEISKEADRNFQLTWGNRWNNWGWNRRRRGGRWPAWNNWRNGWPNWNNFWRNW